MEGLESMGVESCWTLAPIVATEAMATSPTIPRTHEQDRRLDSRRFKCFSSLRFRSSGAGYVYMGSLVSIRYVSNGYICMNVCLLSPSGKGVELLLLVLTPGTRDHVGASREE